MNYQNGDIPETDDEMYAIIAKVKVTKTAKKSRVYGGDIVASVPSGTYHSRETGNYSKTICGKSMFTLRDARFGETDTTEPCKRCLKVAYGPRSLDLVTLVTVVSYQ